MQQIETLEPQPALERAISAEWRLAIAVAAVVALSVWYIAANYRAAFPQASLSIPLSRDQITGRALTFLKSNGLAPPTGFRNVTLFDPDDNARLFLEREAGLDRANRLMQADVPVWRWRARWYRPPEKEEFLVWLAPDGRMVAFDHAVLETAAGERLDGATAHTKAEAFLRAQRSEPHKLVEEKSEELPNRRDHLFTFEREGFSLSDATVRVAVVVRGAKVDSYREYLRVPDQWQRSFTEMRSKNELYTRIAQVFYFLLMAAAVLYLIAYMQRRGIRWFPLVAASAVVGALSILAEWNNLPFYLDGLPTTTSVEEGLLMILLQAAGSGVMTLLMLLLLAGPGSILYGDLLPGKLTLGDALSWRAWRTREAFRAALAGLAMAAGHIAFITAFYLLGQRFGVWSPQDVGHSNLLSTWAPWIYPLTMSLQAATSEEFAFRVLAVPLVKRWTGSTWLAVLLPAFAWGFLHANYPQQPGYVRGVEVGLIGVVAGIVMLRFGILATLTWHYTVDAVLFSTYLFPASDWWLRATGVLVSGAALVPLGYGLWHYRRSGGFLADASLLNAPSEQHLPPAHSPVPAEMPPIAPVWPRQWLYGAAALAAALAWFVDARVAGQGTALSAGMDQVLRIVGPPPQGWKQSVEFVTNIDEDAYEYLRRHVGRDEANRVLLERTRVGVWRVRQFQPKSKTERFFFVDAKGQLFRRDLVLDEKAPGANLNAAEARVAAERHLTEQGIDPSRYRLVDSSSEKRDQRTDHSFVWEDAAFRIGEARARVSLDLLGDQPSELRRFLKLPEEWLREHNKPRIQSMLAPAALGGFGFVAVFGFLRSLSRAPFRWRRYLVPAVAVVLLTLIGEWNQSPAFYNGYDTAQPLADFVSDAMASLVVKAFLIGFVVFIGACALEVFLCLVGGGPRWLMPASLPHSIALAAFAAGIARLYAAAEQWIPGDRFAAAQWAAPPAATALPWLEVIADSGVAAISVALFVSAIVAAGVVLYAPAYRTGFLLVIAAGVALSRGSSVGLILFHFIGTMALFAAVAFAIRTSGAAVYSFALAVFIATVARGAWLLASQYDPGLRNSGFIAAGLGLLVVAAVVWTTASEAPPSGGSLPVETQSTDPSGSALA